MRTRTRKRVTIEDLLIWAYRDEKVDRVEAGPAAGFHTGYGRVSACGTASVERYGLLGCFVDGSRMMVSPRAPDDAVAVHEAVQAFAVETRVLIMVHARAATRPEWRRVPVRCLPVMRLKAGRQVPAVTYHPTEKRPSFCPVQYAGDDERQLACKREAWRLWAHGLQRLAEWFRDGPRVLSRHEVTVHMPELAPWKQTAAGLTCGNSIDIVAAR